MPEIQSHSRLRRTWRCIQVARPATSVSGWGQTIIRIFRGRSRENTKYRLGRRWALRTRQEIDSADYLLGAHPQDTHHLDAGFLCRLRDEHVDRSTMVCSSGLNCKE